MLRYIDVHFYFFRAFFTAFVLYRPLSVVKNKKEWYTSNAQVHAFSQLCNPFCRGDFKVLKVLIADDEELIRQLIKRLVDWDALGLELVAEAENGYEAYDLLVQYSPDIAIVDIRMPGFDGLTLARKIHKVNPNISFMLVSGYQEFEYAKKALELGVKDYILKPIRKEDLTRNLIRIRDAIQNANEAKASHDRIRSIAERTSARVRFQFLKDVVIHKTPSDTFFIPLINHEYSFHFSEGVFQFVFCKSSGSAAKQGLPPFDYNSLSGLFSAHLSSLCYDLESFFFNQRLVCLMNYPAAQGAVVQESLKKVYEFSKTVPAFYGYAPFTIAVGKVVNKLELLQEALCSAEACLDSRFFIGAGKLLTAGNREPAASMQDLISKNDELKFNELLDLNDGEHLKKWIQDILSRPFTCGGSTAPVTELSCHIVSLFRRQEGKLLWQKNKAPTDWEELYDHIYSADYPSEITGMFNNFVDAWYDTDISGSSAYVRFAKEYIEKNYKKNIRLADIAQAENLNPSYLSRIFREETGKTFSDYLTFFRMQIAKELLCNISVNISEVAVEVGYCDSKHFSKSFKKVVGITPKEYRNLHAC